MLPIWDLAFAQWVPGLFIIQCIYWLQSAWAARIVGLLRHRMQSECYLEKLAWQPSLTHIFYYSVSLWHIISSSQGHLTLNGTCGPLITWRPWHELALDTEKDESPKVPAWLGWILIFLWCSLALPFLCYWCGRRVRMDRGWFNRKLLSMTGEVWVGWEL